jgi:hypothetical protein
MSLAWWLFRDEGTLNLLQRCWVGRAGPIPWSGRSCDFTLLDIFWRNVTHHIYIWPFSILLTEGHTKIEDVVRPVVFWDCTQHKVVIRCWYFVITSLSHLRVSRWPIRTCLDSRQPANTDVC